MKTVTVMAASVERALARVPGAPRHPERLGQVGGALEHHVEPVGGHALADDDVARLRQMDAIYQGHCQTVASNAYEVEKAVLDADLVIGAVLVPGAKAPTLVSNELVSRMKPGSVLVDISIDQGGCFETSRATTHTDPVYVEERVLWQLRRSLLSHIPAEPMPATNAGFFWNSSWMMRRLPRQSEERKPPGSSSSSRLRKQTQNTRATRLSQGSWQKVSGSGMPISSISSSQGRPSRQ